MLINAYKCEGSTRKATGTDSRSDPTILRGVGVLMVSFSVVFGPKTLAHPARQLSSKTTPERKCVLSPPRLLLDVYGILRRTSGSTHQASRNSLPVIQLAASQDGWAGLSLLKEVEPLTHVERSLRRTSSPAGFRVKLA